MYAPESTTIEKSLFCMRWYLCWWTISPRG